MEYLIALIVIFLFMIIIIGLYSNRHTTEKVSESITTKTFNYYGIKGNVSNRSINRVNKLSGDGYILVVSNTDEDNGNIVHTIDCDNIGDLTEFIRDIAGTGYDKFASDQLYVVKGVGHKGFSKEELTDQEKDQDTITDIYFRQVDENTN